MHYTAKPLTFVSVSRNIGRQSATLQPQHPVARRREMHVVRRDHRTQVTLTVHLPQKRVQSFGRTLVQIAGYFFGTLLPAALGVAGVAG